MKDELVNVKENISPDEHIPVLVDSLVEHVFLPTDGAMIDATLGHGGHSVVFGKKLGPDGIIIGLDVDQSCIERAHLNLNDLKCKAVLLRKNFSEIADAVKSTGVNKVDFILADLGFCSAQLNDPKRGLSFQTDMPLDMRLDSRNKTTAEHIINKMEQDALADLIFKFGQERASRKIARFIVEHRQHQPIKTTTQLVAIICKALKQRPTGRRSKIHPATRTFQALRIAVNNELGNLEKLLDVADGVLKKNGFIAVISFHSLEDRIVKYDFKQKAASSIYEIITKKPITALDDEIAANPRARSAKLRIARRR